VKTNHAELFTSVPIPKAVLSLVVPTVISQLITVVYNMADTFFIGKLNDPAQVAAATIAMPAFMFLTGIANLFGIGGSSLISRSLGAGEQEKAKHTASVRVLSFFRNHRNCMGDTAGGCDWVSGSRSAVHPIFSETLWQGRLND